VIRGTIPGGLPFAVFAKGGLLTATTMPTGLRRLTGRGDLHFITFCCYQRKALLGSVAARNLAIEILRQVRERYSFALVGYVIMPEHVHLLISESGSATPAKIVQVFKQRVSRRWRGKKRVQKAQLPLPFPEDKLALGRFWQRRYYDFNVYSPAKLQEKLHYMHANPVKEKLVKHPGDWPWSSWSNYYRSGGLVEIDSGAEGFREFGVGPEPTLCKNRKG
jgi:putative transposase